MRIAFLLVAMTVNMAATNAAPITVARIQPDIVCVDPDMEFPVACDDEE